MGWFSTLRSSSITLRIGSSNRHGKSKITNHENVTNREPSFVFMIAAQRFGDPSLGLAMASARVASRGKRIPSAGAPMVTAEAAVLPGQCGSESEKPAVGFEPTTA